MKSLVVILLVCVFQANGQQSTNQEKLDSLKQIVASTNNKDSLINGYNNIARLFIQSPDSCIYYSKKLIEHASSINAHEFVGLGHHYTGIMKYNQHDMPSTIQHYYSALEAYKQINDSTRIALLYTSLGNVYEKIGDNKTALINHFFSEKWYGNDKHGLGYLYHNMAAVYKDMAQYDSATYYYDKSIELKTELGDQSGIAITLNNLGELQKVNGRLQSAKLMFRKAIDLKRAHSSGHSLAVTLGNLGLALIQEDSVAKGIELCKEAEGLYKEENILEDDKDVCECLYLGYQKLKDDSQALNYLIRLNKAKEVLFGQEKTLELARQESKYSYDKKAVVDSLQALEAMRAKDAIVAKEKAEKERAEAKSSRNEIILYFVLVIIVVILIFVYMVVKSLRLVRQQKSKVDLAYEELGEKNQEILDSINYAKRIQSAILPPAKLVKQYLTDSFILYKPKDIVAGDFYWMEPTKEGVLFAAADCTGHGVPGAMVSVVCNNGLNRAVREYGLTDPGQILDKTREIVIAEFHAGRQAGEKSEEEVKDGMDIALCSLHGNTLKYAGAHNPLWVIRKGATEVEEIKADKQPIGKYDEPLPYTTHTVELKEGDSFYIFSDGYADQFGGERGKKYKTANFKRLLLSIQNETIEQQRLLIDEAFEAWRGTLEQLDDVCVIGVRL